MVKIKNINKKQFKESYDKQAQTYDKTRSETRMGKFIDKLQIDFISKHIPKREGIRILEVGCGTGRILIPLAKRLKKLKRFKAEFYGIDPSLNMLNILRKKKKNLKINIKKGEIEKIPYKKDYFDVVYSIHVLMHMNKYDKAIKEMYRVLKPNGVMICDFPNKDSPYTKISIFLNPKERRTHLFSLKDLKRLFRMHKVRFDGIFSYSKAVYKIPFLNYIFYFLEKTIKLPLKFRSQIFVIVKKKHKD